MHKRARFFDDEAQRPGASVLGSWCVRFARADLVKVDRAGSVRVEQREGLGNPAQPRLIHVPADPADCATTLVIYGIVGRVGRFARQPRGPAAFDGGGFRLQLTEFIIMNPARLFPTKKLPKVVFLSPVHAK